ncbi:MAG TPA: DNA translocase FtsK [Dyella sp.]|uniref:DNA translocase FtsK n=1 Tax=Dyella sp. TaxID=1869338 RepID=UPI002F9300B6
MFSLFFGGFGLSTLWLARPVWRLLTLLRRRGGAGGSGAIRFWLGTLAVLSASAALEGVVLDAITAGGDVGGSICRALADGLGSVFGAPLTALLMLAVLALALPWYFGRPWKDALARASEIIEPLGAWAIGGAQWLTDRVSRRAPGRRRARGGAVRRSGRQGRPHRAASTSRVVESSAKPSVPVREHVIDEPWLLPKAVRDGVSPAYRPARPRPPSVSTAAIVAAAQVSQQRRLAEPVATADEVPVPAETPVVPEEPAPVTTYVPESQAGSVAPIRVRSYAANDDIAAGATIDAVVPAPVAAFAPRMRPAPRLPALTLLAPPKLESTHIGDAQLAETGELIEQRLREFKVPVTVVGASAGPVITRFEVEPATGVRGNQIVALMKDLARGLGRSSIRVVETIPGKTCMGLELPNEQRQMIALSEILDSSVYRDAESLLTLAMGKGITGEPVVADLARAPHMLVAGTTGSGKSVAVNAMILSMLYKATPDDVRMIMIDPKMLELSVYEGIPHLLAPVVTDMKLAANALNWCVAEMENRYRLMSELRVRNLAGYNQKVRDAKASGRPLMNPFPAHPEIPENLDTLPLIVVVIDELADLMMVAGKKIEELIARLAQKARAAGIHLILATQRPSVDVITGLIKANIPTRVAFQVSSKIDSRTILDQMGAESLLGQGDMLFLPPGTGYPQRIHGAFVADEEVHRVVTWLKQFGEPDYKDEILAGPPGEGSGELFAEESGDAELDPLYDEAAAFVLRTRRASISFVQRQFRIGYNRAARLVEAMEAAGLVSSMGINGQRDVIAPAPAE